ncbi:alpha/beta hydrolase family esterase [Actinomadura sp. NTSP31]|uniref:alpha/beta hydrolase family esterase n=1 Tax=Actinomadura sp. NTSP31 TaxID=1735447 RepID=UPI0035BF39E1
MSPHPLTPRRRRRLAAGVALTCAALAVPAAASAPSARADALRPDRITVTVDGAPAYRLDGDLRSGGITVTEATPDYNTNKVQGQGTLSGANGGTATVRFGLSRTLAGLSGTFSLDDAGVQISATVISGVQTPSDGTVTWQGQGTVKLGGKTSTRTVGFTVQDRHPDPGDHAIHLVHAGQARVAILRLPDGYDGTPLPALFHFPGLFETPLFAEFYGRMADYAKTRGFIMITPEHYGTGWQGVAGGQPGADVDDPGFVSALQDVLVQRFNADPRRLYASGMSNGGFFTSKLACENKRFAAYAPVSGQLGDQAACHPGRTVPVLMIHGDADPIVPYSTATAAAPFWARNNGCAATTTDTDLPDTHPDDGTTVTRHDYDGCPAGAPVILYQIKGGGHNWPGGTPYLGPLLGGTTEDIDANAVIWDFVSRFRLG